MQGQGGQLGLAAPPSHSTLGHKVFPSCRTLVAAGNTPERLCLVAAGDKAVAVLAPGPWRGQLRSLSKENA